MSRLQRVFLVGACILFVATVYSLFFLKPLFIIIFFALHSMCIFSFCYVCYSDQSEQSRSIKSYQQELGQAIAGKDQELHEKDEILREKDSLIERIRSRLESLQTLHESSQNEVTSLHSRIQRMEEAQSERELEIAREREMEKEKEKEPASRDFGALLPPITPGTEEKETVNIISIANQAKNSLLDAAKAAGLIITVSSATDTLLVSADQGRLMTLFRNIIDNSIKYMKRAGSLVITISTIGDDIFIVLKDTGEGLPTDETKYIFELNYQGSNRISGNGLGLAQARAIVEYYGGTIYAKSTAGNGMGIYIQIPAGGRV